MDGRATDCQAAHVGAGQNSVCLSVRLSYFAFVFRPECEKDAVWMVGPLIAKLPPQVQGRVLKQSGSVLECGSSVLFKSREKERGQKR